jgi:hypothetical protein
MKVFNTFEGLAEERANSSMKARYEDPLYKIKLQDYEDIGGDFYMFVLGFGEKYAPVFDPKYFDKPRYVLTLEEPNFCTEPFAPHAKLATGKGWIPEDRATEKITVDRPPDKVFTLCPFTAESIPNREAVFFPFNPDYTPNSDIKEVDFVYAGTVNHHLEFDKLLKVISENNRTMAYVSWSNGNVRDAYTYEDKLSWYGKAKISIIHNTTNAYNNEDRYSAFHNAENNKAFDHLDKGILPQIKSRVFESAFAKCIMLVKKDPWNVIENFFEPEKDFIYFENEEDFNSITEKLLNDYESYKYIAENAYNKAVNNYTVKHFVERYLMDNTL